MIILADLLQGLQGLEALFTGLMFVLMLAFLFGIILLIVFWGGLSSFFGSIVGSALNRTIAEREYIQKNQASNEAQSPYDTEEQAGNVERPAPRGCGLQILATFLAAGTLYIIFQVFREGHFEASEIWWSIFVSLLSAAAAYSIRQTKRRMNLPQHLSEQGRFQLYLTWFFLCFFANVLLAGNFGGWILDVSALVSVAIFVYQTIINRERERSSESQTDDDPPQDF